MRHRIAVFAVVLLVALAVMHAAGQGDGGGGIQGRIRNAPLSPEQRDTVLRALTGRDYSRIEGALAVPADAPPAQAGEILALLGAIEFLGGRIQQAVTAFQRADAVHSLGDKDRFTFAMAFANLGDEKNSRDQIERLYQQHPEQPLYLYWLARIDYYQRRYEEAAAKLNRVVRLDPGSARAWDSLGLAYDMMGENSEAQRAFEKAVDLNRKLSSPSAWPPMNLGSLLFRTQKLPEAEASLREALRTDSGFAQAHYFLGRVLEQLGKDAEAIDELRTAARLAPGMAEPEYTLGLLYRRLGRTDEASRALAEYKKRREAGQAAPAAPFSPDRQ